MMIVTGSATVFTPRPLAIRRVQKEAHMDAMSASETVVRGRR